MTEDILAEGNGFHVIKRFFKDDATYRYCLEKWIPELTFFGHTIKPGYWWDGRIHDLCYHRPAWRTTSREKADLWIKELIGP